MNNELLLLIKKRTDTLMEQTITKPQETLEFKNVRSKQTFSFNPPIDYIEEGKWLLAVSLFVCTNSVSNITDENNSFSINIPGHWETKSAEKTVDDLKKLLELDSVELHVKEVEKRSYQIIFGDKEIILSEILTFKEEIFEELKKAKYKDIEDLVYRFQLNFDEIIDILDLKFIPTKRISYSLKPNIYQLSDKNNILKNILPDNVKISVTIDEKV